MDNEIEFSPDTALAKKREKRALLRAVFAVTLPCVVFFIVTQYSSDIIIYIGEVFGYTRERMATAFADPVVVKLVQIALSFVLMTVPFILFSKIAGFNISRDAGLKKVDGKRLPYLVFGVGFCAFANIAVNEAGKIFERFGFEETATKSREPEGLYGFLIVVISTAIVPGILEEFAFRGIVTGILKPFGEGFSIIACASLFALLHGNFEQIAFAFLVGLVLGFVRIRTGSLILCMAIHAINNFVAIMANSPGTFVPSQIKNIIYGAYIMLALTLSIAGVAMLKGEDYKFRSGDGALSAKEINVNFFLSLPVIAVFMLYLYRALSVLFE